MKNSLEYSLSNICQDFTVALESFIGSNLSGTCYLIGHCLAEGFKRAGYEATEETGTAIFKDKFGKNVIYGKQIIKGRNIGYYHTWCRIRFNEIELILDPSYKYNKPFFRQYGLKPNSSIPDVIITDQRSSWLHQFLQDDRLIGQSKQWLGKIPPELTEELIEVVRESVVKWIGPLKQLTA